MMKDFFDKNGKSVVKLYVNQIVMSVFGLIVVVGFAGGSNNELIICLASLAAVVLYLFIIYSMMWEAGAKAAAKTLKAEDAGVKKIKTPLLIILFGSVFNILCYVTYTAFKIYVSVNNITNGDSAAIGNLTWTVIKMTNAIYMGFEAVLFPNPNLGLTADQVTGPVVMLTPPYYFFLTLIPLFAVGIAGYYLGASEISILRRLGFKPKQKTNNTSGTDRRWFK